MVGLDCSCLFFLEVMCCDRKVCPGAVADHLPDLRQDIKPYMALCATVHEMFTKVPFLLDDHLFFSPLEQSVACEWLFDLSMTNIF